MNECRICGRQFNTSRGLSFHIRQTHKITIQQYYDKFIKEEEEGNCLQCSAPTKFLSLTLGYRQFCSVSCARSNEQTHLRARNTCLERYGNETYNNRDKNVRTCLERYGVPNVSYDEQVILKKQNTFISNHGIKNNFGNKKVLQKAIQNSQSEKAIQKRKQTCLKRYGHEWHIASKEVRGKSIKTNIERFGVENPFCIPEVKQKAIKNAQTKEAWQKRYKTLRGNGNSSSLEDLLYEELKNKGINFIPQYKDKRYPFNCDFYLPDTDCFVEINDFWMHGEHWFNSNNLEDVKIVELWKSRNTQQYNYAIKAWTVYDINKKMYAEKNNLNYVVLWNKEQINDFINSL